MLEVLILQGRRFHIFDDATDKDPSLILILKVIYHPLYGMNNYVLIWGDWLSCDPLRGSHDSQSPHIWVIGYHATLSEGQMIANHPI